MKKMFIGLSLEKKLNKLLNFKRIVLFLMCFAVTAVYSNAYSQNQPNKTLTGIVTDENGDPIPGVNIVVKGTSIGTITNMDGNYSLSVPADAVTLLFSFIGMEKQEMAIDNLSIINVTMQSTDIGLDEVVVVGYGLQKKESIVGAISNVGSKALKRTGGVANLAQALTGQLAGVTTIQSTGEPGNDDPKILIRGMSTWNNAEPLVLVDGVERKMNDIDVSEVESVSILKDASATAVFGVKGAEGVILITTKRGKLGKPQLTIEANTSLKNLSRTPDKFGGYEGLKYRNRAIEYELPASEQGWGRYMPIGMVNRYRKPQAPGDEYIFPNVDWADEMLKDFAVSHRVNLNVSGGTNFAKYFGSLSYTHDGDILKSGLDNGKGYKSKWAYDRFNFRSNIDFSITSSTTLSVNLSGYLGEKYESFLPVDSNGAIFSAFYQMSPTIFPVRFPDGKWGYTPESNERNAVAYLNNYGVEKIARSQVNTDFTLKQQLDFITEGLSAQASLSYDNRFYSSGGIFEYGRNFVQKFIYPDIINKEPGESDDDYTAYNPAVGINDFDFYVQPPNILSESILTEDYFGTRHDLDNAYRRMFYQFQVNYARTFNKHDVGATALVNRDEYAKGSMFPTYREDWVGRVTYNYDGRYLFESNAAYNGSEKFAEDFRFGFFPSVAIGWLASNESFLQKDWLDKLKFRYSIGKVGNDNFYAPRWAYETIWAIDDVTRFGTPTSANSPYTQYKESVIGNPDLQWEVSVKQNLGLEFAIFQNMFNLNVELFSDNRNSIFMNASQRKIPAYFGAQPVAANLGKTKTKGYEIELKFRNTTSKGLTYWANWSFTHAIDEIIFMEDPALMPDYQKKEGFQIGQTRTQIHDGYLNNWDEVYASVNLQSNNHYKLPGDVRIIDFNGDGLIDTYDNAPYAYPLRPQNTYNFSLGLTYKGFSGHLQFYGVYNVSRPIYYLSPFKDRDQAVVFKAQEDTWSPLNNDADWKAERFQSSSPNGTLYIFDGSYLRLKTAEVSYTIRNKWMKQLGASSARIFLNGNNLFFWSKMPDDREDNSSTDMYPTYKRFNLGVNINF